MKTVYGDSKPLVLAAVFVGLVNVSSSNAEEKSRKDETVLVSPQGDQTVVQVFKRKKVLSKNADPQLAIEWASDGVLINTVFPSMVETPMLRENVESAVLEPIEKAIPLGRIARSVEVAAAIEFLISERNTYITGAGIDINGGQFLSG